MNNERDSALGLSRRLIGEFVIIVLGVLAALAVDNWREERAEQELQSMYLARFADDLDRDLQSLRSATWSSMAQARATTTLLDALGDPQAYNIPRMTDSLDSVDFTRPAHEVIDTSFGGLVWTSRRIRTFAPSRATYDELLATGRLLVIEDPGLRESIIDYYSFAENVEGIDEWMQQSTDQMEAVLQESGYNAFDYHYIDDPLPLLRELDGLPVTLRDVRRRALRQVAVLEWVEEKTRALQAKIEEKR
jgi:hypothetical protein